MMYWGNGMSGWGYALMLVSVVLFWALLIGGLTLLVRSVGDNRRAAAPPTDPTDPRRLLGERFARGDIDEDEYRQRMDVLTGS